MIAASFKNIGIGLVVGLVLIASWFMLKHLHPGNVEIGALRSLGWPLAVGMAAGMMVAGGFGVPPLLFVFPAAAIWSFPLALGVCVSGGMGASISGFLMARYALREKVVPRIPPKLGTFEKRLETHAFSTVLVLRLLFYLFPPINWMLGISRISLGSFTLATFLGMLPVTVLYLWAGQGLIGFLLSLTPLHSLLP